MARKTILEVAVFLFLGAAAISGWVRRPEPANAANGSPRTPELATESGAYANDEASDTAVEGNSSANLTSTNSEPGINGAQAGTNPCGASPKPAVYNDRYYTGPYSSSSRPVRVSTVARQTHESYAPIEISYPERKAKHGRTGKRTMAVPGRAAGAGAATGDLASGEKRVGNRSAETTTAAFVYDRNERSR
jgi:hypothetical protein